ncbi:MAG: hypothetical protein AAGC92_08875 [Pseudomonadota bacterium]
MTCETWLDLQCLSAMARHRCESRAAQRDQGLGLLQWREGGIAVDVSGLAMSRTAQDVLHDLARDSGVFDRRAALFEGRRDKRDPGAALPTTMLRRPWGHSAMVDGTELSLEIAGARHWPECLAQAVREGALRGATGRPFRTVLHLGPEPSSVAARRILHALNGARSGPRVHFVSPKDGTPDTVLAGLDPAETLVILAFEAFSNAPARGLVDPVVAWLRAALGHAGAVTHLVAVTASARQALDLGVAAERVIAAGSEWLVGYTVWSPLHLGLKIALGNECLAEMRAGGWQADLHFRDSADADNLALQLGLADVWIEQAFGDLRSAAVAPSSWDGIAAAQIASRAACRSEFPIQAMEDRDREAWQDLALIQHAAMVRQADGPINALGTESPGFVPAIVIACRSHTPRMLGRLIALNEHRQDVAETIRAAQRKPVRAADPAPIAGSNVVSLADRRTPQAHP